MRIRELKALLESDVAPGIVKALQRKGYKLLGKGADQFAFLEPGSNMILKIFGSSRSGQSTIDLTPAQETFKAFADYCLANPNNQFLPQFTGWEKFVYDDAIYLQIRMERLFEFKQHRNWANVLGDIAYSAEHYRDVSSKKDFIDDYIDNVEDRDRDSDQSRAAQELLTHLGMDGFSQLWDTINDLGRIASRQGFNLDLHPGNFMLGSDGHIVISDPFFIGWGRN